MISSVPQKQPPARTAHLAVKAYLKGPREFRLGCCYRTAEDALKDIARHRPDMVLINVRLPGMSGAARVLVQCTK